MMKSLVLITCLFLFHGCIEYKEDPLCSQYKLLSFEEMRKSTSIEPPKEITQAGKIYLYENLLLVNELYKGVHVIDNSDKNNPVSKAFVNLPGNVDIAVKNGFMYVDTFLDLVVIDIRDLDKIQEVNRTRDVFNYDWLDVMDYGDDIIILQEYGTSTNIYDECNFDRTKGIVIGVQND